MKMNWSFTDAETAAVKALVEAATPNVLEWRLKNRHGTASAVERDRFWRAMVQARVTSVQRSGPDSPAGLLHQESQFPLSYERMMLAPDGESFMQQELKRRGFRHNNLIAQQLASNLSFLEQGGWHTTLAECNRLVARATDPEARRKSEREVARYIGGLRPRAADGSTAKRFLGFGPKQSRNLLQMLSLTRYETPIDSRVVRWFGKNIQFPVPLSPALLSDQEYYEFVSDGIQELCLQAGVLPCDFDAAAFADGRDYDARVATDAI